MTVLQSIILGLIQGIAEFLPISSSGHLAVAQNLFGLDEVPLLYDILLHVATLLAVVIYFRKKIGRLFCVLGRWIVRRPSIQKEDETDFLSGTEERGRRTIIAVLISTFVTGVIGVLTSKLIPELSIKITCLGFVVTAFLLIFSSVMEKNNAKRTKTLSEEKKSAMQTHGISWVQALLIGFMQGIAAGEYSFIISIPAILGAFVLGLKDYLELLKEGAISEMQSIKIGVTLAGCLVAFVSGYFALFFLMKLIKKGRLEWFAFYLVPLGVLGMIFLK